MASAGEKGGGRRSSSPSTDRHDHNLSGDGGITPLHLAAQHGHADAVYLLLNEGLLAEYDPQVGDKNSRIALPWAILG